MYCKKVTKGGGIHRMKQHLVGVKGDIRPCKSEKHLKQLMSLKIHMVPMCHNLKGMSNKVKKRFNKCKFL